MVTREKVMESLCVNVRQGSSKQDIVKLYKKELELPQTLKRLGVGGDVDGSPKLAELLEIAQEVVTNLDNYAEYLKERGLLTPPPAPSMPFS